MGFNSVVFKGTYLLPSNLFQSKFSFFTKIESDFASFPPLLLLEYFSQVA